MEMIDFNAKKGFLCDMDGVIYHGNHILPGAAEFIHWLQDTHKEYLFLTNNSGMTPRELHQKLGRMGLDVPEEHFYTSALATAAFLADQTPGCSVYALGEAGLLNALYDRGITMNDVNPTMSSSARHGPTRSTHSRRRRISYSRARSSSARTPTPAVRRTRASPPRAARSLPRSRSPPASRRISAASRTRS